MHAATSSALRFRWKRCSAARGAAIMFTRRSLSGDVGAATGAIEDTCSRWPSRTDCAVRRGGWGTRRGEGGGQRADDPLGCFSASCVIASSKVPSCGGSQFKREIGHEYHPSSSQPLIDSCIQLLRGQPRRTWADPTDRLAVQSWAQTWPRLAEFCCLDVRRRVRFLLT